MNNICWTTDINLDCGVWSSKFFEKISRLTFKFDPKSIKLVTKTRYCNTLKICNKLGTGNVRFDVQADYVLGVFGCQNRAQNSLELNWDSESETNWEMKLNLTQKPWKTKAQHPKHFYNFKEFQTGFKSQRTEMLSCSRLPSQQISLIGLAECAKQLNNSFLKGYI
jgi:hypothetical protein